MNGSIDFYADDCKVTIETNWTGAGDYQLIRADGTATPLGDCQTLPDMLSAVLDTEWSSEMEGAGRRQAGDHGPAARTGDSSKLPTPPPSPGTGPATRRRALRAELPRHARRAPDRYFSNRVKTR